MSSGLKFHSDMLPGKDVVITKPVLGRNGDDGVQRFTDLATITIDGETRDLYDFGLDVGEVFDNGVVRLEVTAVDTAYFEGYERRVLTMDSGEQWIDGIGSTRGLLAPVTEPTEEYEEVLLSCRSGDVVMYVNPVYGSGIDERYAATASAYVSDGAHGFRRHGAFAATARLAARSLRRHRVWLRRSGMPRQGGAVRLLLRRHDRRWKSHWDVGETHIMRLYNMPLMDGAYYINNVKIHIRQSLGTEKHPSQGF